jgi:hypothetical protein
MTENPLPSTVDDFDLGETEGLNPQPDTGARRSGELTTTNTSWWHTHWCTTCGHTFRRGDRVRVDAGSRTVLHLDPALGCASQAEPVTMQRDDADVAQFVAGLLDAWPVVGDLPVVRTDDEPYLLAGPRGGFRRQSCLVCGHSFRGNELVLVCPCSPMNHQCRRAVHRDPGLGLVCWENWRPGSTVDVCPVNLQRVRQ